MFRKPCQCPITASGLPQPVLKVLSGFDTDSPSPEIRIAVDMLCSTCGKPWESFAGLKYEPKKPKLIISP